MWDQQNKNPTPNPKGGQRKPRELRELVIHIAQTTGFGYTRIIGELRKMGIKKISRQTVRNILKEEGISPGPDRTWKIPLSLTTRNVNHVFQFSDLTA
jgi:putative transposase